MASNPIAFQIDASVTAALRGDAMSGFEEVYLRYRRRVYSLCLRMMGDIAEAEDMTQEVFIQLHRKLGSFRGEAAFATWLHRLTVNQVLMYFRRRATKKAQAPKEDLLNGTEQSSPGSRYLPVIDHIALEEAIERLAPGCREIFVLCDVEGYNHHEAAKLLGCSVGNTKAQLHRARMKLREILMLKGFSKIPPGRGRRQKHAA